jgi:hypothetical protein
MQQKTKTKLSIVVDFMIQIMMMIVLCLYNLLWCNVGRFFKCLMMMRGMRMLNKYLKKLFYTRITRIFNQKTEKKCN